MKYPKAQAFLDEHPGWTLDQALVYFDELEKRSGVDADKPRY